MSGAQRSTSKPALIALPFSQLFAKPGLCIDLADAWRRSFDNVPATAQGEFDDSNWAVTQSLGEIVRATKHLGQNDGIKVVVVCQAG